MKPVLTFLLALSVVISTSAGTGPRIGAVDSRSAARVIEARGKVVAPGFIGVHKYVEGSLAHNPAAENFVYMGVTSIVTGNCGTSSLGVGGFLSQLESKVISVNAATLVGHGSVRRDAVKEEAREPSAEDLQRMRETVERAMREGALGISTGLIYVPGTYAKTGEIVELAKIVAGYGGVYATHMRDVGAQANLPVDISHFNVSSKKRWGDSRATCQMIADARARALWAGKAGGRRS
jgi:N-acyl-D-amino-acid deacylase